MCQAGKPVEVCLDCYSCLASIYRFLDQIATCYHKGQPSPNAAQCWDHVASGPNEAIRYLGRPTPRFVRREDLDRPISNQALVDQSGFWVLEVVTAG